VEVEEIEPTNPELAETIQAMKDRGIHIVYGRWLIEGAPRVLLFDLKSASHYKNEWKADLWNVASIPSPDNDDETNDAVVFGYLVAWFLGEVSADGVVLSLLCADMLAVCLPREEEGCDCPFPRVARGCSASVDKEAHD